MAERSSQRRSRRKFEIIEFPQKSGWKSPDPTSFLKGHAKEKILLIRGVRYFSPRYHNTSPKNPVQGFLPFTNYVILRYTSNLTPRELGEKVQGTSILEDTMGFLWVSTGEFLLNINDINEGDFGKVEELVAVYERADETEIALTKFIGENMGGTLPRRLKKRIRGFSI